MKVKDIEIFLWFCLALVLQPQSLAELQTIVKNASALFSRYCAAGIESAATDVHNRLVQNIDCRGRVSTLVFFVLSSAFDTVDPTRCAGKTLPHQWNGPQMGPLLSQQSNADLFSGITELQNVCRLLQRSVPQDSVL